MVGPFQSANGVAAFIASSSNSFLKQKQLSHKYTMQALSNPNKSFRVLLNIIKYIINNALNFINMIGI